MRPLFFLLLLPHLLIAQMEPQRVQTWVLSQPWRFHLGDRKPLHVCLRRRGGGRKRQGLGPDR